MENIVTTSGVEPMEIVDESTDDEAKFRLYIDGAPRAFVRKKHNRVDMCWEVYGPQQWPAAKILLQGLLQLSVWADQLAEEESGEKTS
jgi:hypothetical protein